MKPDAKSLQSLRGQVDVKAEADRRLARMRAPGKKFLDAVLPGEPALPLKMAVLTCTDIAVARAEAFAYLQNDLGLDPSLTINLDLYQDEILTQILYRACRDPEKPDDLLAASSKDFRDSCTADERLALFDIYNDWRDSLDPTLGSMPPELLKAIEEAVKKKDEAGLIAFGGRRLSAYLLSLADRPTP